MGDLLDKLVECSVDDPRWLDLVEADPQALPFHHPAWTHLLADAYGFKPFVLGLNDAGRGLAVGLPVVEVRRGSRRRWVSLPFTDICPPLTNGGEEGSLAEMLERARLAAGVASLEVRAALAGAGTEAEAALLHVLPLQADADAVAATFRPSVRRNIRAAQRSDAVVRIASSEPDLTERFYKLHVDVRRRLGLPVQPLRFFRLLWSRMVRPGLGRVFLVDVGEETVAAAVFLAWNHSVVYKYGASEPRYWPLRPNNLLFWEAIKWACESGYERLDFGRTDPGSDSLRRFKLGWGTEELPLRYTVLGARAGSGRIEPPRIARGAIRRLPRWVVRALGEILYRRAA